MSQDWVDFKAIKAAVTIQQVIEHYRLTDLKPERDELVGRCPIHKGEGERAFHVSFSKNAFHCFSCKKRGNVFDFVAAMEQCSIREAARKLQSWFGEREEAAPAAARPTPAQDRRRKRKAESPRCTAQKDESTMGDSGTEMLINPPLKFVLSSIDSVHPSLGGRGLSQEVTGRFGLGFFSGKGSMSGRLVIPIHNQAGELVAYAGRAVDDTEPRYKFPPGFHKSAELYNLHRALALQPRPQTVVLVEGFFSCIKLCAAGVPTVALMGSSLSGQQAALLIEYFTGVVLLLDGDEAGRACTEECLVRLGKQLWVRAVMLEDSKQPDHYGSEELIDLLGL